MDIAILFGSTRENRNGFPVATFVEQQLQKRGHTTHLIDPAQLELPTLQKMYKSYEDDVPEALENVHKTFASADGFIIVSAEYNHSVPPALKNILDHFQEEYFFKPSGIVCYSVGGFGGVRAAIALRPILAELGMSSIPSMFPVKNVTETFKDGELQDDRYKEWFEKFVSEFEWYAEALRDRRAEGTPY